MLTLGKIVLLWRRHKGQTRDCSNVIWNERHFLKHRSTFLILDLYLRICTFKFVFDNIYSLFKVNISTKYYWLWTDCLVFSFLWSKRAGILDFCLKELFQIFKNSILSLIVKTQLGTTYIELNSLNNFSFCAKNW